MRRWSAVVVMLLAVEAAAWPVDWIHEVGAGKERFVRLPEVDWYEVAEPGVAALEWFGSGELLVTGKQPGRTHALLLAQGQAAVWLVRVGEAAVREASPAMVEAARAACPDLKVAPPRVVATVETEACRQALLTLFQTDLVEARNLELTFSPEALKAQLTAITQALKAAGLGHLTARYVGAGLVLEGKASARDHRRALWEVFRASVGRVALDDHVEVEPAVPSGAAADGGPATAP